jgi:hypothetical protein
MGEARFDYSFAGTVYMYVHMYVQLSMQIYVHTYEMKMITEAIMIEPAIIA